MRGMRKRRNAKKEKSCLDMISPTSFYSSEGDKVKLNWFCYELALSIYDGMKDELAPRLRRKKISDEVLAEFSIHYAKAMKDEVLRQLSGEIEKVCISYESIEAFFPNIGDDMVNKMTDTISHAWTQMLSICEVCPNRCISEKDAFCTLFDEKHLFE
ncbi:MAG: hypothetical protein WAV83_01835 [Methanothrix sp.]|uniref:hypothetical protein n=2 Tax=Methanothrix sp. TaxID=90426 RepID=UPI003BB12CAE